MKDSPHNIASFVLRFAPKVWLDEQREPHFQWRGQIRHVQGDQEIKFTDFAQAVAFMQRHLMQTALDSIEGGHTMDQESVIAESFKLWEQFASTYSKMMFEAMEQAIEQSEALRAQMDQAAERALGTWQPPASASQADVLEALHKLQAQVEALAARLDKLERVAKKPARPKKAK